MCKVTEEREELVCVCVCVLDGEGGQVGRRDCSLSPVLWTGDSHRNQSKLADCRPWRAVRLAIEVWKLLTMKGSDKCMAILNDLDIPYKESKPQGYWDFFLLHTALTAMLCT